MTGVAKRRLKRALIAALSVLLALLLVVGGYVVYVLIAYYRKEKGLSQSQLAELVNVSRTHMSRIENADCAVSLDVVFDICDALCIKPSRLFDFRD